MTLEEKVGQMTQLEIGMITKGEGDNIQIDAEKLEKAIVKYGVGFNSQRDGSGANCRISGTRSSVRFKQQVSEHG